MNTKLHTKAGFIALVGCPNAGKSTLLNRMVGVKIAPVSPKAQTTRLPLRGILTTPAAQLIFVDTPGVFSGKRALEEAMAETVQQTWQAADVVLHVLDATKGLTELDQKLAQSLKQSGKPCFLALNKIDVIKAKEELLPLLARINELAVYQEVFPISALKGDQIPVLLATLSAHLPDSPFLYDPDQLTDAPVQLQAAELTREKAFLYLQDELPYGIAVLPIHAEDMPDGSLKLDQHILVERDNHKGMVIGEKGQMLKKIGSAARKDLEKLFARKVHLFLQVKVKANWAHDRRQLAELGFVR